jgi:hypothetical protein
LGLVVADADARECAPPLSPAIPSRGEKNAEENEDCIVSAGVSSQSGIGGTTRVLDLMSVCSTAVVFQRKFFWGVGSSPNVFHERERKGRKGERDEPDREDRHGSRSETPQWQ